VTVMEASETGSDESEGSDDSEPEGADLLHLLHLLQAQHTDPHLLHAVHSEGHATEREQQQLSHVDAESPALRLQEGLALQAARTMKGLREAAPALPSEVLLVISDQVCSLKTTTVTGMCSCTKDQQPTDDIMRPGAGITCVCAECGCPRVVSVHPKIPFDGDILRLQSRRVSSGVRARWKFCRHFHRDAHGEVEHCVAVRHRASGLHSFRTIVCDEWVVSGSQSYRLHLAHLTSPYAVGIGVVTPWANVNATTAWCAGTRGWAHAWGLCIEGPDTGGEHHEIRALEDEVHATCSGWSNPCGREGGIPKLVHDDMVEVVVDSTSRSLTITKLAPAAAQDTLREPPITFCLGDATHAAQEAVPPLPLALVVALKFAGDECRLA